MSTHTRDMNSVNYISLAQYVRNVDEYKHRYRWIAPSIRYIKENGVDIVIIVTLIGGGIALCALVLPPFSSVGLGLIAAGIGYLIGKQKDATNEAKSKKLSAKSISQGRRTIKQLKDEVPLKSSKRFVPKDVETIQRMITQEPSLSVIEDKENI